MNKRIGVFVILLMLLTLCACNKNEQSGVPTGYTIDQKRGGITASNVNISEITFSNEDKMQISIKTQQNSDISGTGATPLKELPEYSIECVSSPHSLIVSFKNVEFVDFERNAPECDFVKGVFYDKISGKLCFRMPFSFAYALNEQGDTLNIEIAKRTDNDENSFAYYVTANLCDRYNAGEAIGALMPTITRDGRSILISKAYSTEKEAREQLETLQKSSPDYPFELVAMYDNELPIYNEDMDYYTAPDKIFRMSGDVTAECIIKNGFVLAENQGKLLYEKITATDEDSTYSRLFIKDGDSSKQLMGFDFAGCEKLQYSPDSSKLAILENARTGSHLYIFDPQSGELLYDLSDAGLGKRISGFTWNDLGTAIYAIGGTGNIAINMYDFSVTNEAKRKSVIYDGVVDEGSFELYNGSLYYTVSDEKGSTIHRLKPQLSIASPVCKGSGFAFSGDNMAVTTASTVASLTEGFSFHIINMKTDDKQLVTDSFAVYEFVWSESGKYLYYVENRHAGDDTESATVAEDYPYSIYRYDVESKSGVKLCDLTSYSRLGVKGDNLLVMYAESESINDKTVSSYSTYELICG